MLGRNYHGYSSACEVLHLQTLDGRRSTLCLKFAKKLLNSEEYRGWLPELRGDVSGRSWLEEPDEGEQGASTWPVHIGSNRVVTWWNSLPEEVVLVAAPSVNSFKNRPDKHMRSHAVVYNPRALDNPHKMTMSTQ
ncbi:hypothetical protein Bbelb_079420 [Branchiostoma belcheri]|nr:hypothetical protein Bbelb_079420 [Branchiostoma belcheri]